MDNDLSRKGKRERKKKTDHYDRSLRRTGNEVTRLNQTVRKVIF